MRTRVIWSSFCLAFLLALGACSKSGQSDKLPPMEVEGINVDTPQLSAEFVNASPELQSKVNAGVTNVRYKRYVQAMTDLDGVLNSPGITEKQKELLTKVLGQLKEVAAKNPGNQ